MVVCQLFLCLDKKCTACTIFKAVSGVADGGQQFIIGRRQMNNRADSSPPHGLPEKFGQFKSNAFHEHFSNSFKTLL